MQIGLERYRPRRGDATTGRGALPGSRIHEACPCCESAERLATDASATIRCARACGDIRSRSGTGGMRGGVVAPARRGRVAAGGASSDMGLAMAGVLVEDGRGNAEPTEQRAKRRGAPRCSGFRGRRDGRHTEGGGGGEMQAVQRLCRAGGGRGVVQHGAWCRFGAGLDGMPTRAEEGAALSCVSLVGFGGRSYCELCRDM